MFQSSNSSDIYAVYNTGNMPPPGGKKKGTRGKPTADDIAKAKHVNLQTGKHTGSAKSAGSIQYQPSGAASSPGAGAAAAAARREGGLTPTGSSDPSSGVPVASAASSWQKPALVVGGIVVVLGGLYFFTRKSGKQGRSSQTHSVQVQAPAPRPVPMPPAELMDHPAQAEHMDFSAG